MKKTILILGIIFMLVGLSISPIVGSISKDKQSTNNKLPYVSTGSDSGISLITVKVAGEMGLNDWYVSDIGFNFTYESDDISLIKYRIDDGPMWEYIEPFFITEDGEHIYFEWYAVDKDGNYSEAYGPFIFNLDQTEPDIELNYEIIGGNPIEGWTLEFNATVSDAMSGIDCVEFFLNDVLQDTDCEGPYFTWQWKTHGDLKVSIKATAYDIAGNSATDWIVQPKNDDVLEQSMHNLDINKGIIVQNCFNADSSDIIEFKNYNFDEKLCSEVGGREIFDPDCIIVFFNRKIGPNDWIISDVSFSINTEPDGIGEVYYKINEGDWKLYNESLIISDDGVYNFSWFVIDTEGFISTPDTLSFKIDNTCPEINLIRERILMKTVKFTADVYDETSGINKVYFESGWGGEYTDYDFPYEWYWVAGEWLGWFFDKVDVTVYDNAGHTKHCSMNVRESLSYNQQYSFNSKTQNILPSIENDLSFDDTTPPITTHSLDPLTPDGDNGWYVSDVTVSLNATDDISGVNITYYRVDGGEWEVYDSTFVISEDGDGILIEYYSVDNADNQEPIKQVSIDMDQTKPSVDYHFFWETVDEEKCIFGYTFVVTATDDISDMNRVEFFITEDELYDTLYGLGPEYTFHILQDFDFSVKGYICKINITDNYVKFFAIVVTESESMNFSTCYLPFPIAYDNAGNYKIDMIVKPPPPSPWKRYFKWYKFPNDYKGTIGSYYIDAIFEKRPTSVSIVPNLLNFEPNNLFLRFLDHFPLLHHLLDIWRHVFV